MKHSLLQLACVGAIGAVAMGAQAQYAQPPSSAGKPSAPSTAGASAVKVDADYAAAVARCNRLIGAAKGDCLRDAKADYDRATNEMPSGMGAAEGSSSHRGGPAAARQ